MGISISFLPAPPRVPIYLDGQTDRTWQTWFTQIFYFLRGGTFVDMGSSTAVSMIANTVYTTGATTLTTLTLPTRLAVGDTFQVIGKGTGGWAIAQNVGQIVYASPTPTTLGTGGSIASSVRYDTVTLQAITADTELSIVAYRGNLTVT